MVITPAALLECHQAWHKTHLVLTETTAIALRLKRDYEATELSVGLAVRSDKAYTNDAARKAAIELAMVGMSVTAAYLEADEQRRESAAVEERAREELRTLRLLLEFAREEMRAQIEAATAVRAANDDLPF